MNQNDYKSALDKIVVSDELKEKIVSKCSSDKRSSRKTPIFNKQFRNVLGIAACTVICVLTLLAVNSRYPMLFDKMQNPISDNESTDNDRDNILLSTETPQTAADEKNQTDSAANFPESGTIGGTLSVSDNTTQTIQSQYDPSDLQHAESVYYSLEEAESALGYRIQFPHVLPESYTLDSVTVSSWGLTEIRYENEKDDVLYYRTAQDLQNISGVYTVYDNVETVTMQDNNEITVEGNDGLYCLAVWYGESDAFSIYSPEGLEKETLIDIAQSVS